jgi:gamma-glutamyltranspeptidase/glutathione hydrolase
VAPPDDVEGWALEAPSSDGPNSGVRTIGDGDTTHLCALDADGLGVSLTQSNALDFGSNLVAGSTGVFLHNRGLGFSLEPGHPAELAPRRRPPHTLSPALITRTDGSLAYLLGAMGGDAQPQILLQLAARLLAGGADVATAVDAPRLVLGARDAEPFRLWWERELVLQVEQNAPADWVAGLRERGHEVDLIGAFDPATVGCAQCISLEPGPGGPATVGWMAGGSDPRSPEGGAVGR